MPVVAGCAPLVVFAVCRVRAAIAIASRSRSRDGVCVFRSPLQCKQSPCSGNYFNITSAEWLSEIDDGVGDDTSLVPPRPSRERARSPTRFEPRVARSPAEVASRSPAGRQVARSPGRQVARSPAVASGRQWVASKVASRGVCAWQPQVASMSPGRQQVARSPGRSPGRQPGLKQCVSLQVWISHLSCTLQSPLLYFVDFNVFSHNIQPQTQLP